MTGGIVSHRITRGQTAKPDSNLDGNRVKLHDLVNVP